MVKGIKLSTVCRSRQSVVVVRCVTVKYRMLKLYISSEAHQRSKCKNIQPLYVAAALRDSGKSVSCERERVRAETLAGNGA